MNKYIDAEKLIAEIERYKQGAAIARFDNAGENADYFQGKVDLCDDLTHIVASLHQEQPGVDLENYISNKLRELGADLINHKPYSFNCGLNVGKANAYNDILDRLNARK